MAAAEEWPGIMYVTAMVLPDGKLDEYAYHQRFLYWMPLPTKSFIIDDVGY